LLQLLLGKQGGSVSMGMEEEFFVCLGVGGLAVMVWEPAKKVRRLPSYLEGPGLWLGAMVGGRVQPVIEGVVSWGQERV